ncbi:MAG: DNA-directed RNA polymerase subunit omega [Oscillospiraceae bacterium]|jgi:DNA-directed RNA polymerase subunit omega|nr:DNA-directed RNA polymerase subunit omega [Oscillospiraceae bacterium]MBQ1741779.1 DNA-directed RNA polymerase subunit omega [Oscillospiraceae bacterium]MBQ1804452.1 DNA-directed RNA polymerase subunit omega [Oscillospiraceae bacterium]MBQ1834703.1 DNA-directed RNA polymerase subunit omega [Oscillospiraceae bacterium]MBQ2177864.1 DNA-directed RNA polymerase subunit omega [Oscillospiraceae bacterium]
MMLYPAMSKLNESVPNRYLLVNVVARRARQIAEAADVSGTPLTEKAVTTAINEVADGKITSGGVDISIKR